MSLKASLENIKENLKAIKTKFIQAAEKFGIVITDNVSFKDYPKIFSRIDLGTGTEEVEETWTYPSDWIDVHKVLEEDTYDAEYFNYGRAVLLMLNNSESDVFPLGKSSTSMAYAIRTSDGAFYNYDVDGSSVTHTWQASEEKTRWIVCYYRDVYRGRTYVIHSSYTPSNILYAYLDVKGFCFDTDYGLKTGKYKDFQGLECTPETTLSFCGDSGQTIPYSPLCYVNLPIEYGLGNISPSWFMDNSWNLKYQHIKKMPPYSAKYIRTNCIDFDNFDWSLYAGEVIADDLTCNMVKGVIDLSQYISDKEVNIGTHIRRCKLRDLRIKLPNAPVKINLGGGYCDKSDMSVFWTYLAENAPIVEGRTLNIYSQYMYASLVTDMTLINGLTPYNLLRSKGWTIKSVTYYLQEG